MRIHLNYFKMPYQFLKPGKLAFMCCAVILATTSFAQDGTIYPLETPAEPNAVKLRTGGVSIGWMLISFSTRVIKAIQ